MPHPPGSRMENYDYLDGPIQTRTPAVEETPEADEIAAALKRHPKLLWKLLTTLRVAGPWTSTFTPEDGNVHYRPKPHGGWAWTIAATRDPALDDKAKADADDSLRAKGWLLID